MPIDEVNAEANNTPFANSDMEAHIQSRLATMLRMALHIDRERKTRADEPLFECAIAGLINGAAIEIISLLGMRPQYSNLYPSHDPLEHSPGFFMPPRKASEPAFGKLWTGRKAQNKETP